MSKTYWELLRDPRWQRKRLEVMQAAEFACVECGATERTLNVHHTVYEKGKKPWEYDTASLRCFCEPCHLAIEQNLANLRFAFSDLTYPMRMALMGYARGLMWLEQYGYTPKSGKYDGLGDALGVSGAEVEANIEANIEVLLDIARKRRGEQTMPEIEAANASAIMEAAFPGVPYAELFPGDFPPEEAPSGD